jgi:hypothetical protein
VRQNINVRIRAVEHWLKSIAFDIVAVSAGPIEIRPVEFQVRITFMWDPMLHIERGVFSVFEDVALAVKVASKLLQDTFL